MKDVSNKCNKSIHFAVRLLSSAFVDDLLISLAEDHRQVMINTTKYLLSLFGFECKGFDQSYQDASKEGQTTDDEGFMTVAGYRWKPSCDMLQLKTVEITNGKRVRGRYKKAQSSSDFFREHIDSQEKANEGYIRKLFEESNTKMTLRLCVSRASSVFSLASSISTFFASALPIIAPRKTVKKIRYNSHLEITFCIVLKSVTITFY